METVLAVTDDKAHYLPGSSIFSPKLIADRASRKLLGIQVLGGGAVDKMVDHRRYRHFHGSGAGGF